MGTATTLRLAAAHLAPDVDVTPVTFDVLAGAAVEQVIPEWDACSARAGNSFLLSPWLATAIWNMDVARRGELYLVTGRDAAGSLQTVFPLWLSRSRMPVLGLSTLQPLGLYAQETSSVVVGESDRAIATDRVAEFLLAPEAPPYDVLHLPTIDPRGELFAALVARAERHAMPVLTSAPMITAFIQPARGPAQALPGPSPRLRRNIRRAWRRAQKSGAEVVCREISWDWEAHQQAVARIDSARWGEAQPGSSYALHDDGVQRLVAAAMGRLDRHFRAHAFAAFVDGEVAAYVICFRSGPEVILWSASLDDRFRHLNAGMLLWDYCLHEIAGWPGVARINFSKGAERYKLDWSDSACGVCELAIVRATGLRRRRAIARFPDLSPASAGLHIGD